MGRPKWFVELLKKSFPGRFTFARLTNLPAIGELVDYGLFRDDDILYLPRDGTIQINQRIERSADMVLPSQVVEHFIENANYHWLMDFCICRESNGCRDFPAGLGCLFLGVAVLKINPQFGRLVTKEEALEHVRHCRQAGLVHMIGRNKLDSVWLGANPGEKLLTICNCCPCCCLWKILPEVNPLISAKVQRMPGVRVAVDTMLCAGCGTCTQGVCFVEAIQLVEGSAYINGDCRGCGRCVEICPNEAITLTVEGDTFVDESIRRLALLVDVT